MMQVASAFILVKVVHGYGVVITKKIKYSNGIQISYVQGLLVFFSSVILLPIVQDKPVDYMVYV